MNIFAKIKNSIYGPEYYREVLDKPFFYSFKYYILLSLLLSFVFAIAVTIKFVPKANFFALEMEKVPEKFPINLEIKIKDGKVSANVEQPYFVKLPKDFKGSENIDQDTSSLNNLIVINTKDGFDLQKFQSYKTLALLTEDSIIHISDRNQIVINSLSQIKDFTVNRGVITNFFDKITPFLGVLYPIIFIFSYIGSFLLCLFGLLYLLLGALFIWLVASLLGLNIGYKKSYQLGLHIATFPIIITGIVFTLSFYNPIPFLFIILLVLSALLNIRKPALDTFYKKE